MCQWIGHRGLAHEHHITPQKAGGGNSEDNLVVLCAGCHHSIHMIGTAIQHGRLSDANDMLALSYCDPTERRKARKLARIVAVEFAQQRERGGPSVHTVTLPIPHNLFVILQTLGQESTAKLGVARYIMAVMQEHAARRGYVAAERGRVVKRQVAAPDDPLTFTQG